MESRPSDFELEVIGFGGVTEMPAGTGGRGVGDIWIKRRLLHGRSLNKQCSVSRFRVLRLWISELQDRTNLHRGPLREQAKRDREVAEATLRVAETEGPKIAEAARKPKKPAVRDSGRATAGGNQKPAWRRRKSAPGCPWLKRSPQGLN
jgi:hypothetical protein